LRPCKNHAAILQVFRRILDREPNAVLLLVGDGPMRAAIQDQIQQLQLTPHVRILGIRSDATALMQVADVFLFPSLREGLSVAVMEASAVGLPIVASDIPGNREATENGASARLHDIQDIEGMAGSVVDLLRDSDARQHLGAIARQVYEQSFSMEASICRLSELYDRVLHRPSTEPITNFGLHGRILT
ncbi:MAG TPA: glycosyltransferase family 4 protein, partial [Lacipirellulaceae bacterium]|nr:glycosyltransferase family 4 protein [Lacipirellulaceae bacterium]